MTPTDNEHLNRILEGCRKERRASQHELYKRFFPYGMSVAIRYMQQHNDAVSVLNDAFLKVFVNIKSYDPNQPFKPWLRRIIVNTALTQLTKDKRIRSRETAMPDHRDFSDREAILSQIGYKELITLVQSLSTSYRAVFNMYVIDGFKHEEIAQQLGISVSTSKSNLLRARRKLQDLVTRQLLTTHA